MFGVEQPASAMQSVRCHHIVGACPGPCRTKVRDVWGFLQAFGGWTVQYKHASTECGCDMNFTVYYPPQAKSGPVPVRPLLPAVFPGCLCHTSDNHFRRTSRLSLSEAAVLAPASAASDESLLCHSDRHDHITDMNTFPMMPISERSA